MFDLIADLMAYFYDLTSSYSVAIALLTLVVLVIATPLTLTGTRSMLKMQILQPELKAIQDKYPKDKREEMNAELMAFYKENNINPVGGCLPLLFQIPVFLVLYRVILGLTRRATDVGSQLGLVTAGLREGAAPQRFEAAGSANFNPAYLGSDSQLFEDLSTSNEMSSLGVDLSRSASAVLGDGLVAALPYLLIVLVVGLTGWFQHRMIRSRNTGAVVNPTQETIMKVMPFFLPVFSFSLPAAIVIYFLVSNLYRIGQQWYITYSMYHGEDSLGAQVRKAREETAKQSKSGAKKGSGGSKAGGSKAGGSKAGGSKGGSKNAASRGGAAKGSGGGRRTGTKTVAGSGAPGRNRSGRQGSARTQVQPRARKKKKR